MAHLLVEDRRPSKELWKEPLTARALLARVALLELTPIVLARALDPFPRPVRTLDALHLASMEYLRTQGQHVELASYDDRMVLVARALGIPVREM